MFAARNLFLTASAVAKDLFFRYVTMLLPGNGTNGRQNNTFLDSSTNNFTITRVGNTTQGTFAPYGSLWSNYFDGTGDYITSSQSQTIPATGDFTIDGWFWCNTYTNYPSILSQGTSGNAGRFNIYINNDGKFGVQIGATANNIGSAVPTNQWVHFAVTRSGSTVTVYINGASIGTVTNGTSVQNTTPSIGSEWSGDPYRWIGYLSNIRVSNVVRTISLPASPFVADANTVLLTCQSNRFIDTSTTAATLTPNGNVSVQRFSPFNPTAPYAAGTDGGSGYFDGTGDYLTAPDNIAFEFGSGNFTIEGWFYLTGGNSTFRTLVAKSSRDDPSGEGSFVVQISNANKLQMLFDNVTGGGWVIDVQGTTNVVLNTWYHFAVVRNGNVFTAYLNGVSEVTATNSLTLVDNAQVLTIGALGYTSGTFIAFVPGYISDVRLVKGTAVYTSAFTPPSAPLTAITNTSLLLNFTNAGIIDNAEMNNLETVGNAQISTAQSKFGGASMAFDGNGDYLTIPPTPQLNFGSGDWTIEFWAYLNTTSGNQSVLHTANFSGDEPGGVYIRFTSGSLNLGASTDNTYGTRVEVTSSVALSVATWTHCACVRSGNTLYVYINGISRGSVAFSGSAYWSSSLFTRIGYWRDADIQYLNAYLDDFRITKGYARYTTNFTPPSAPFPTQ